MFLLILQPNFTVLLKLSFDFKILVSNRITTKSKRKLTILRHGNKKWCISENVNLFFLLMLNSKYCWDPVKTKIPNSELSTLEYWLVCLYTSFRNFLQQNKYTLVLFYKIEYKTIVILLTVYSVWSISTLCETSPIYSRISPFRNVNWEVILSRKSQKVQNQP